MSYTVYSLTACTPKSAPGPTLDVWEAFIFTFFSINSKALVAVVYYDENVFQSFNVRIAVFYQIHHFRV